MILKKYDIVLERLKEKDLELVRNHRNSENIRATMEYREYITPEMQKKWFASVNNNQNFYLLIHYKGEKIGLINAKNIQWEKQALESGIFLWETKYYESFIPAIVSIMVTDLCFRLFAWDAVYAHVMKTNKRAIQYNINLGYQLCENQENAENQLYKLTPERFEKVIGKLRKALGRLYPGNESTQYILEVEDFENGIAAQVQPLIEIAKSRLENLDIEEKDGAVIYAF
jgi:RimJ/RimL family protein N-acetyltransferase